MRAIIATIRDVCAKIIFTKEHQSRMSQTRLLVVDSNQTEMVFHFIRNARLAASGTEQKHIQKFIAANEQATLD